MKIVPNTRINYEPASIKKMVRCRTGDKPLSESMLVRLTVVVAHKSLSLDELTHKYYDMQHILITTLESTHCGPVIDRALHH